MSKQKKQPRLVVLISGRGSNLAAISDAIQTQQLHVQLVGVISNRADAPGLQLARERHHATFCIDETCYPNRDAFEHALLECLQELHADVIALAGFMRVLSATIIEPFRNKIINIHPSLLPKHKGLHTHRRVLECGDRKHGCTTHYVTEALDSGRHIMQEEIEVYSDDTERTLAQRVLAKEHYIYPRTIACVCKEQFDEDKI